MKTKLLLPLIIIYSFCFLNIFPYSNQAMAAKSQDYASQPPFLSVGVPPLVMLVMGKSHKLFFEAYNDATDLNNDGVLDIKYDPSIEYYGYFDSYKQYEYDSTDNRFEPVAVALDKKVTAADRWSGDFLNYVTMSRIDAIRKVLYGGKRSTDTATDTTLERAYIPYDAHCWGKEYDPTDFNASVAGSYPISDYTPYTQPAAGNRHLFATGSLVAPSDTSYAPLLRVKLDSNRRIWEWVSVESGNHPLEITALIPAPVEDFDVRVQVGVPSLLNLRNEIAYTDSSSNTVYKPIGFLQRHGASDRMYFGLITGSYERNLSGGVLRKNISSITDEINVDTGEFEYQDASIDGIIKTIDNIQVIGYDHGSHMWDFKTYAAPITDGQNYMWGNPTAEMMYEGLRYFAGESAGTSDFIGSISDGDDQGLDLPLKSWANPYATYGSCAKPFMLVISDINPSYDTDQLPNVNPDFSTGFTDSGSLGAMDVDSLADSISTTEGIAGDRFIGQSGTSEDNACSAKTVAGLGSIRGLCPEEPTRLGGYYSASVAYYGRTNDINTISDDQYVRTYAVGLSSPMPEIKIPMDGGRFITVVPFAKTVSSGGGGGVTPARGDFQPTCAIVDFYVASYSSTSGEIRVTYEHAEQGSDYDMDGDVSYRYTKTSGTEVEIIIENVNAVTGGSSRQHFGYIISGTTNDGVFMDVKNRLHTDAGDVDYYLDTPGACGPNTGVADMCWQDGTFLPAIRTRTFTLDTSAGAATLLKNPLWYAAKYGNFTDTDSGTLTNVPDAQDEWDEDGDGNPDAYFYVQNPLELENKLGESFLSILAEVSSGSAASVISQTRSGEGAVYQAIFYPEFKDDLGNNISWPGDIHALFVDGYGNMREDTNGNDALDMIDDRIIVFNNNEVEKYYDSDGDGQYISRYETGSDFEGPTITINEIEYLWSANEWLNEMTNGEAIAQRVNYNDTTQNRYIFTFIDENKNMIVDFDGSGNSDEIVAFQSESFASISDDDLKDPSQIYPYLTLFPTFGDEDPDINTFRTNDLSGFRDALRTQSIRVIDYIRGMDQGEATVGTLTIPAFRSRVADWDGDNSLTVNGGSPTDQETYRLGDVINSSPTVVGRPAENNHLLYRDLSYATFARAFKNRRQVIYSGANDGMLHAFNGGFYHAYDNSFKKYYDYNKNGVPDVPAFPYYHENETQWELGAEMWAYIPYNLLPHLYWLTEEDYPHVYYNDLKPKIFDAKILEPNKHYSSGGTSSWGTFLIAGMRFGGGTIIADMDKTDGPASLPIDRTMKSAYYLFDITDPEVKPELIAELSFDGLGYTTCYPAIVPMKDRNLTTGLIDENEWYLVFGSGPADVNGLPGTSTSLTEAKSSQASKLFVVNLKTLTQNYVLGTNELQILDGTSNTFVTAPVVAPGPNYYVELDNNSFVSDPISVDYDLDYTADALYFGTIEYISGSGATNQWNGKLRRFVFDDGTGSVNPFDLATWIKDSTLYEDMALSQPIQAAPSVAIGSQIKGLYSGNYVTMDERNRWVYFGTGRFLTEGDKSNSDQQSYYGIKEPFDPTDDSGDTDTIVDHAVWNWNTVASTSLLDVSNAVISYDTSNGNKIVTGVDTLLGVAITDWTGLLTEMDYNASGWAMEFDETRERNLGQAALLGDILTFTTYAPSNDLCVSAGNSNLYALYYKTGTAHYTSVIGDDELAGVKTMYKKIDIGPGLALTPNIHVGYGDGTKAFIQKSTGEIIPIEQTNPGTVKSGVVTWEPID